MKTLQVPLLAPSRVAAQTHSSPQKWLCWYLPGAGICGVEPDGYGFVWSPISGPDWTKGSEVSIEPNKCLIGGLHSEQKQTSGTEGDTQMSNRQAKGQTPKQQNTRGSTRLLSFFHSCFLRHHFLSACAGSLGPRHSEDLWQQGRP